ncbi:MAG: TIGR01777 family oxidoreductase [Geminocystis sp.]|nr:TIGR01777 family oxidoreductase [Geminocystis sp.]HIK37589.1 TIGR01777 family protein [Geminocystis sp. M7585_C2015_104]MCS7146608.1 TIGR01777 family oxidoreductase [Geminocystis sp.]MCX8077493.1 TIGR01777 family oxidoreductase [Geminocystis sp.]MDW8115434.1 TIGR01777 family oxidoreductase [Geminocystis sp.]
MRIAITGATGFIGRELVRQLGRENTIVVLTRDSRKAKSLISNPSNLEVVAYNPKEEGDWQTKIDGCDAVVNLAGAPISERWTASYKREILESRQIGTRKIVEAIAKAGNRPKVLINASAVGYYGTSETETYTETSAPGSDFLAQVCQAWETEAEKVKETGVRLVILRLGIVLGKDGGVLAKMITPFKLFAGGPIGSGKQWVSWIHIQDVVGIVNQALNNTQLEGVFNATTPNPVTMQQLCQTLGEVLKRPSWLPVPPFALQLLLGEGAQVVLEGQRVLPKRTLEVMQYSYYYPQVKPALEAIFCN